VPQSQGSGHQTPNFYDLLYVRAHSMRNNNQILHCDQIRNEKKILQGRPRTLTRDLFAVANFIIIDGQT